MFPQYTLHIHCFPKIPRVRVILLDLDIKNHNSTGSIVAAGCRMDNWGARVWVPIGLKIFTFFLYCLDWLQGPSSHLSSGYY
jgi:hypothetical protein